MSLMKILAAKMLLIEDLNGTGILPAMYRIPLVEILRSELTCLHMYGHGFEG